MLFNSLHTTTKHMIKNVNIQALCVDASCTGNPGVMEYRAVDLHTWKEVFHSPIYSMGTNNLGEFLAIYDAIRYIEKLEKKSKSKTLNPQHDEVVPLSTRQSLQQPKAHKYECIFSDSETAIARVKSKKIKTTLAYTDETKDLLMKVQEAATWLKTHHFDIPIRKRETEIRWEIPADFDRK